MSAPELEEWLKTDSSTESGWSKDDGSGETIGHDRYLSILPSSPSHHNMTLRRQFVGGVMLMQNSGRKIIGILKKNPKKDPEKYDQGMPSPCPAFT